MWHPLVSPRAAPSMDPQFKAHNAVFLLHAEALSMLCACLVCKLISKEACGTRLAPEGMRWGKLDVCITGSQAPSLQLLMASGVPAQARGSSGDVRQSAHGLVPVG